MIDWILIIAKYTCSKNSLDFTEKNKILNRKIILKSLNNRRGGLVQKSHMQKKLMYAAPHGLLTYLCKVTTKLLKNLMKDTRNINFL